MNRSNPTRSLRVMSMAMRQRRYERRCQSHSLRDTDINRAAGRGTCPAPGPAGE